MRNFLFGVPFLLITALQTKAQSSVPEIGFGAGISFYQGDLSPHWLGTYNRPNFAFQVTAQQNIFPAVAIRANYIFAPVSDDEKDYQGGVHQLRNFSFRTSINEFSAQLVFNPKFSNGEEEVGDLHTYFFGGIGVGLINVQREWQNFNYGYSHWQPWVLSGLKEDSLASLPTAILTVPVGMGIRYQIGDNIALYGEFNKRITRSEYIDGFSRAANSKKKDGFASFTV